jgi:FkbM family methyltransferase
MALMKAGHVYDAEIVDLARSFVKPGTTVLDLGACFGQMAVLFAQMVGENGRVAAFEASPYLADIVRRNVRENGMADRVRVHCAAVWNRGGMPFSYPFPDWSLFGSYGSFFVDPDRAKAGWQVETLAIDELHFVRPVSFMKVDVQGSDLAAMQGTVETIRRFRMPIVFEYEVLLEERFQYKFEDYLAFVDRIGYRIEKVINGCNYLILPRSRLARIGELMARSSKRVLLRAPRKAG